MDNKDNSKSAKKMSSSNDPIDMTSEELLALIGRRGCAIDPRATYAPTPLEDRNFKPCFGSTRYRIADDEFGTFVDFENEVESLQIASPMEARAVINVLMKAYGAEVLHVYTT